MYADRWGNLTHARVLGVLGNPCYAGTYVYGRYATRRRVEPDGTIRTGVRLLPVISGPSCCTTTTRATSPGPSSSISRRG
ncbi:recombinase family protein [Streptomyces sp. NPDC057445]|uniref:recombinase family protein n=1 Tax=Streptomyces sp. NPDC057445 TaxID=3346136 RepID=UPI0036C1C1D4